MLTALTGCAVLSIWWEPLLVTLLAIVLYIAAYKFEWVPWMSWKYKTATLREACDGRHMYGWLILVGCPLAVWLSWLLIVAKASGEHLLISEVALLFVVPLFFLLCLCELGLWAKCILVNSVLLVYYREGRKAEDSRAAEQARKHIARSRGIHRMLCALQGVSLSEVVGSVLLENEIHGAEA